MDSSVSGTTSSWEIEALLRSAFSRTKDRLLSYFLATILNIVIVVAGVLVTLLLVFVIGLLTAALTAAGGPVMGVVVGSIAVVMYVCISIYIFSWIFLTMTDVVISDTKVGVMETFKKVRPLVPGFFILMLLSFVFVVGILWLGILSLGTVILLWNIWGTFTLFVYMQEKKSGLQSLWISREMVNQRFWGIIIRLLLIYVSFIFLQWILIASFDKLLIFLSGIIGYLSYPFIISYTYSMYKNLKVPEVPKRPIVWIVLSIIGWVVILATIYFGYTIAVQSIEKLKKQVPGYSSKSTTYQQTEQKSSPADSFMLSAKTKFSTANLMAEKKNLTNEDRTQIQALINGALSDLKTAALKDPSNYLIWYDLGDMYTQLIGASSGADKYAIDAYKQAIILKSDDYLSYMALGGVYYRTKDYNNAIKNFQKVVDIKPDYGNGWFNLGMAYKQAGAKGEARKAIQKALYLLPKDEPTRYKAESELQGI